MRKTLYTAAVALALGFAAPAPAQAQIVIGGYPSYNGGYSNYGYGNVLPFGNGGLIQAGLNLGSGNVGGYNSGYSPNFYSPGYRGFNSGFGGYNGFNSPFYGSNYGNFGNFGNYGYGNRVYYNNRGGRWR